MQPSLFTSHIAALQLQAARLSPLMLADRLLTLAQEADRSGLHGSAVRLLGLAYAVLDEEAPCAA